MPDRHTSAINRENFPKLWSLSVSKCSVTVIRNGQVLEITDVKKCKATWHGPCKAPGIGGRMVRILRKPRRHIMFTDHHPHHSARCHRRLRYRSCSPASASLARLPRPMPRKSRPASRLSATPISILPMPAGRAALDQRIKAAAETVCRTGMNDAAAKSAESRCVKTPSPPPACHPGLSPMAGQGAGSADPALFLRVFGSSGDRQQLGARRQRPRIGRVPCPARLPNSVVEQSRRRRGCGRSGCPPPIPASAPDRASGRRCRDRRRWRSRPVLTEADRTAGTVTPCAENQRVAAPARNR